MFRKAEDGTIFQRIWDKNGGDSGNEYFNGELSGLEMLLREDKTALFYTREGFLHFQEFRCTVVMPWRTKYPAFLTMGFPKNSPYYPFFSYQMLRHFENGVVPALRERWLTFGTDHCKDDGLKPLGFEKLVCLFGLLAAAALAAVGVFSVEKILTIGRSEDTGKTREQDTKTKMIHKLQEIMINHGILQERKFVADMADLIRLANAREHDPLVF